MPIEPIPAASSSDDFDRQLRDITSGTAGAARFLELSAAERARMAGSRRPRWPRSLRKRMIARKLRKPAAGQKDRRKPAAPSGRKPVRLVGGRGSQPAAGRPRQRLRGIAKNAGILVGFVALLVVLHLIGFGPH